MAKKPPLPGKSLDLNEYRDRAAAEGQIVVAFGDGDPFIVPPVALWADNVAELAMAGRVAETAAAIIGPTEWDRFRAAGGTGHLLLAGLEDVIGVDLGKSVS